MGRLYTVVFAGTITNAGGDTDLLEIVAATNKPVILRGIALSQISEVGDAAEEGLRLSIIRLPATVTSGSGGSAATPATLDSSDAAAAFTAEVNNTTIASTSGTALTLAEYGWNVRNSPYELWFPDERFAPKVRGAEYLVVRLQTTAADDITAQCTFWIEEL
jgi:hypothetical protein